MSDDYTFADWNTVIEVAIIGMWGHDAYKEKYRYSGAKGHYPNTTYRFTRFGQGSIDDKAHLDIQIKATDLREGYGNSLFRVVKVFKPKFTPCKGMDLGDGNYSGCDQSAGDCTECGL